MTNKPKSENKNISWNTKFYVLLAGLMTVFALSAGVDESNTIKGGLLALFIVTMIDLLEIIYHNYSRAWKVIKVSFFIILLLLIIIG